MDELALAQNNPLLLCLKLFSIVILASLNNSLKREMLLFLNAIGFFSGLYVIYINQELSFIETFS